LISIWNYANVGTIDQVIKDFKPDVIHSNCLYEFSPIVWKVARKNSVRVIHTLRDYHLMCPLVAMSCKYTEGKKCISPRMSCRLHRTENRRHSCYVDCVTAPSKCTLDLLLKEGFFKKSDKKVIPNAINYDIDAARKTLDLRMRELHTRKTIRFVYLGGLTEQKGIRWMINAFQMIPKVKDVEITIAGKGLLQDYVEAEANKDSRIRYVGFLNETQVTELLHNSDVLLCPSLWDEPFGRVVLDAYKNGLPVISSNRGALPELVKNMKTGLVVEGGNIEDLCSAMQQFVENRSLITIYGKNAIEELSKYSLYSQAKAFEQVYHN
jgi:glycosyltransferase involved in cell wall biosynthesis